MHRYRIIAQIYFILSILNLVLAAPVVVQRTDETSSDNLPDVSDLEMGPAEDVAAIPNESGELKPAPDRSIYPAPSSPNVMASPQHSLDGSMSPGPPPSPNEMVSPQHSPPLSPNAMISPQHPLDGSTDSGYSIPYLESASSDSGYSWMLERPARQSPHNPLPPHALELSHDLPSEPPEISSMEYPGIIKVLAALGTIAGGVWGLNKFIHRDCRDC